MLFFHHIGDIGASNLIREVSVSGSVHLGILAGRYIHLNALVRESGDALLTFGIITFSIAAKRES